MFRYVLAAVSVAILVAACGGDSSPTEEPAGEPAPIVEEPTQEPAEPAGIPGIAAVDVYGNLENTGFSCDSGAGQWSCESEQGGGVTLSASATGPSATAIMEVSATAMSLDGLPVDDAAGPFFGFLATLPYEGAEPQAAGEWIESSIGQDASETFGPVEFHLGAPSDFVRTLVLRPAP